MTQARILIDGDKLKADILKSPFNMTQICVYMRKNSTFVSQATTRGTIFREELDQICELIGKNPEMYIISKPEPELPKSRPMTAKNDPEQNWLVNIYRAIEDLNDRIEENTDAVRGVRQAVKEYQELLGPIKLATESLKTSQQFSAQETKKQLEKIFNRLEYGRTT